MTKKKRHLIPHLPHHITQRGTRREKIFFCDEDYRLYLLILGKWCREKSVEVWSYCLMPNHVHPILVPETHEGISQVMGFTQKRYARFINERFEWTGNLWQERFNSSILDEAHLLNAVRYVEQNPVRAKLASCPEDWKWSSAYSHIFARQDGLTNIKALDPYIVDWRDYLSTNLNDS